jgi:hypothetical protein
MRSKTRMARFSQSETRRQSRLYFNNFASPWSHGNALAVLRARSCKRLDGKEIAVIKIKHVMTLAMLGMFALTVPAGCAMEAGAEGEAQSTDDSASPSESTDESTDNLAAVTYHWRLSGGDSCRDLCESTPKCGCEPTKRCRAAVPNGQVCTTWGDVCAKVSGNGVSISYFTCK